MPAELEAVDCPGPSSLKEKLGLNHVERSVVAERRYLLVFHHIVFGIHYGAFFYAAVQGQYGRTRGTQGHVRTFRVLQ